MSDIDPFFQEPTRLTIAGREVTIKSLQVKHFSRMTKLAAPFLSKEISLPDIVAETESVIEILSLVTDAPVEWLNDLDAASFIRIINAVIKMNMDFFGKFVIPLIHEFTAVVSGTAGQTLSLDSHISD